MGIPTLQLRERCRCCVSSSCVRGAGGAGFVSSVRLAMNDGTTRRLSCCHNIAAVDQISTTTWLCDVR